MDFVYLGIVIFLFALSCFDLYVGVSNDAVNFLGSAIGAKVARFKTILIIAAVGIFVGATTSDGMMDIARHGIFRPEFFSFEELMCIFLAVVASDVILLDIFNTLGMPTSTTVSMVFELLGGSTALALVKTMFAVVYYMGSYLLIPEEHSPYYVKFLLEGNSHFLCPRLLVISADKYMAEIIFFFCPHYKV